MLLSRLAESCYWLGRYLERCADLSAALLAYEQLRLDIPGPETPGWQLLAPIAGIECNSVAEPDPQMLLERMVLDRENPGSLLGALHRARENLRRARFLFPFECWQTLNPLYLRLLALEAEERSMAREVDLDGLLAGAVRASQEFAGQIAGGMLRDHAHAFLRMGLYVERADMMFRVARVMTDALIPATSRFRFEDVRWMGLLKSIGAYHTYRRRYQTRSDFGNALELLLFEPSFPRSYAHALLQIDRDLEGLPRSAPAREAVRRSWPAALVGTREALEPYARRALQDLAGLQAVIESTYFLPEAEPILAEDVRAPAASPAGPGERQRVEAART
jgi:uncharacterized alpha-E superfamily protein